MTFGNEPYILYVVNQTDSRSGISMNLGLFCEVYTKAVTSKVALTRERHKNRVLRTERPNTMKGDEG